MSDQEAPAAHVDRVALFAGIAGKTQKLIADYLKRLGAGGPTIGIPDPRVVTSAFEALCRQWLENPEPLLRAQIAFTLDAGELMLRHLRQFWLKTPPASPVSGERPEAGDKRFKDDLWAKNQVFEFVKQAYLLASRHLQTCVAETPGLDPQVARKVNFYTRQFVNAMAPTNFLATNPQALKLTLETGGENLLVGLSNLLSDLDRNKGRLMPRMTDLSAFRLGDNVATTPGKVVFQNQLMQLIQYAPATETVHRRPLLIIPPWINKFYILDLKPKNSLIRWAVEQGHTVFVISWVNPDERLRDKDFADYMLEGPLAALDAIAAATGEREVNAAGYCIGGTLLGSTLGYMAAGKDGRYPADRIRSATFFATLLEFSEVGEMAVFIDEEQVASLEAYMKQKGYLEGTEMANAFNMLRENDLIWSFVVNNYLLGREPMPFDLLYWNSDSTRMPAAMHSFYLRNMFLRNRLREPGGISLAGVPIDLHQVQVPAYFVSTREDHIAPWRGTYKGARLLSGPVRFVLGGSGHIAGIVNPPSQNKYGYTSSTLPALPEDPEEWLAGSQAQEGSWWLDWQRWQKPHLGEAQPARHPGGGELRPIEEAPGSYVKVRI